MNCITVNTDGHNRRCENTFSLTVPQAKNYTNAQGYDIMARAIRDAIVQTDKFKALAR